MLLPYLLKTDWISHILLDAKALNSTENKCTLKDTVKSDLLVIVTFTVSTWIIQP